MVENEDRRKNWRPIMVVLGLLLGALLTASAAFAGLPASVPAGVAAGPPMQGKSDQGQQQQQQAEDPSKGKLGPVLPDTISIDGKPQESVSGGTPLPTPCGPSSIYFELEPNNTITTAHVLGSKNNAEVRGAINSAGDIDYYSFVANAGDRIWAYAFTLGAVSSTDSQLQLLDALSQTIQFDDDNGSQADLSSAIAGRVVTQTATYYLRVNAFSSTSTIMPYTLFIDRTSTEPVPEVEPNNTFTQPNPYVVGSVVTGTIVTTADLDVYSFEFFDDDRYVFQVDGDPERDGSEFDPNFDLMNAAGAVLVTVDSDSQFDVRERNSENAAFFIDTGGPPTSTLLLRVRTDNDGGGTATGTYTLHIWRVGEVPCGNSPTPTVTNTATPVCNTFISEIEPNGTFTTAQTLPTLDDLEVRAPIQPAGDVDYYTGNATAGDKIWAYLFTGQSTSGADSELRILNAVSTTIQYDDDNGSQTAASSSIAGAPITTSGAIYFRVNEFNNDGTITPYSLFIDRTSSTPNVTEVEPNDVFTQANMVTVGDLITGSITLTTDNDVFGFTASAGDRIIFQADGDPERDGVQYNPNFDILDSAGAVLVAVDSDSSLGDRRSEAHAFTFGAPGTYYVRMESDSSAGTNPTGSYNLHLWRTASPPCASATPVATGTAVPPTFTATAIVTSTNTTVVTSTNTTVVTSTSTVAATATICPPASTPVQEVEPNNTITNANTLANISGAEVRGGITPAGDQDFFSFQANAGDRIWTYINTSNAAPSTDSILTLVNATGGVYQLDDDNGFQSTLSSAIAGGVITQTGTAGIGVRQFGGATVMNPYSLYIDRTTGAAIPEVEPNNVFTQANVYNFGTVVTGSIPISTDLDYFTFSLALNEKIVIQVDGDPDRNGTNLSRVNQFNPNFDLLDANGAPITAVDSDSQGGNGGLLSENLVFTNTNILSTTFGVRIKFDPSTPVDDDLGIYNLHIFKVGNVSGCPVTTTPTVAATATVVPPTNTVGTVGTASPTVCVPSSGTWVAVATAPAPGRYNVSGVVGTDGKFYVMTGQDSANAPVANNDVFDPATNTWSSASPVPSPVQAHPALGSVAGKIYMSGGSVASTPVATTRIYDIATNSWSTGANAPSPFRAAQYATYGGNLYVFGGINAVGTGTPITTTMIYSTTANSWSMGAPLPDVKFYGFAAEWGGMIYLYGGANSTAVNSTLWRYNPTTDSWATLTSGPNARIRLAMSARDGKLYATGGSTTPGNSFAQTNTVDVYDIATDTWSAGPNMIAPRNTHVQGTLPDGRIIAAVGLTTGNVRTQSAEVLPRGAGCPTPSVVPTTGATNTVPPTVAATVTTGVSPTVCVANPVNLVLDDGTVENSVGWTNSTMNFTAIWINRSSPPAASFPMNLTNISIKWPNSAALVGKTIALLVYHDADGDGDPSDAVKVAQVNGQTITVANGTTFQDFPVNVNIPTAGDVYYGFADTYNSGGVSPRTFPAPLDTTATQGRSWVAAQDGTEDPDFDNLGNNDNLGTIDALSGGALTGNWVIRASGTGGGGCPTGTVVATITAGPTATCVPVTGGWSQGALLPVPLVRAWGVYFPPNGKLYAMGGRTADGTGTAQLNPLEYTPSTNTWITKTAVFSDQQTSNVQGGYLTMSGTPVIVVVGGSAGGGTGGTTETRIYNPVADTLTTLTTDPWTPGTTTVPGGSAVWNNKLYIFGGFDIPGAIASDEIWEFDPNRAAGSRWVLKSAVLPTPLAYIPAATIGNFIYTGGGSLIEGGTLADSDLAFRYDPATDTITSIATLPNVTAETRAVAFNGEMWVLGGGRTAPNPSSNVLIYTPGTDTWRSGPAFTLARRNFPADTDGTSKIWLAGGYAPSAPTDNMEIFTQGVICGSPTVTSTPVPSNTTVPPTVTTTRTATRTSTSVPTAISTNTTGPTSTSTTVPPTSCPLSFVDVPPSNEFYTYIRCLVCRFIISGYNDRTFRPNNNIIRGQIAKMVSNSAGFDEDPGAQIYEDVPPSNEFYPWINRLSRRGVMTGYPCGSNVYEPCGPENRPYFRWNANATRGQISQIVARGAGLTDPPGDQRYTDVPPNSTFFIPIQQLSNMGVMSGYPCGGVNPQTGQAEPCDELNRPYFRPGNLATRAQASKIVANTFFPGCVTPGGPLNSDANLPNVNMLRSAQPVAPAKPASND